MKWRMGGPTVPGNYNLVRRGVVYCDGVQLRKVFAFDTEEGWADAYDTNAEGMVFPDPADRTRAKSTRHTGVITVMLVTPEGGSRLIAETPKPRSAPPPINPAHWRF